MEALTTKQALIYIRDNTTRTTMPLRGQLNRWNNYGWIKRYTVGIDGRPNTYTVDALDALCDKINSNYRRKRNS